VGDAMVGNVPIFQVLQLIVLQKGLARTVAGVSQWVVQKAHNPAL